MHYHAKNGRFAENGFVNSKYQKIIFWGVGAHHQNGIIKNKNKLLTNGARTLLLHGIRMWPQMKDEMFWPFSIKDVSERHNILHLDQKLVPRFARTVTWSRGPRLWRGFTHGPPITATCL